MPPSNHNLPWIKKYPPIEKKTSRRKQSPNTSASEASAPGLSGFPAPWGHARSAQNNNKQGHNNTTNNKQQQT